MCSKEPKIMSNNDEKYKHFYICFYFDILKYECQGIQIQISLNLILSFGFSIRLLNLNNNCVKNNKFCILSYEKVKRTKKLVTFLLLNRSSCLLWMHLHPNENCLNYFLWTIKHVFCMTIFCTCGLHLKLNFLRLMNIRNESNGKIKKFLPLQAFEILI